MSKPYVRKHRLALFVKLVLLVGERGQLRSGELATALGVPHRYIEPELQRFVRAGILISRRGPAGGYTLGRSLQRITVADVMDAVATIWEADATAGPEIGNVDSVLAVFDRDHRQRLSSTTLASLATAPLVEAA